MTETAGFPQIHAEHPYNLSFILHEGMQKLFGPMHLLRRPGVDAFDVGVGMRRAHDRRMKLVGELEIVEITPASHQQARVLAPPHRLPDRELPHG